MFNKLREPVSGLMQLFAAIVAAFGLVALLMVSQGDIGKQVSLFVYGASLVLMFSARAAHHLIEAKPHVSQFLRKLDHSSIYRLSAGTYTPICFQLSNDFWRWSLLAIIWSMAGAATLLKLSILYAARWVTAAIYLLMGWLAVVAIQEIFIALPITALMWLFLGGILFTVGAVIYVAKRPNFYPGVFGFHELWHVFVILGCLCHFIVIAGFIAPNAV